jgi:transcriptional regulator with XRE-family HTH domain
MARLQQNSFLGKRAMTAVANPAAHADAATAAVVLSKAVVRAARLLGLTQQQLAAVLGVSAATASRLAAGTYILSADRAKEWELSRLFVRLFRSLDALWGHGDEAHAWLATPNVALAARPVDLIVGIEGLVRVVAYLDAARGRV